MIRKILITYIFISISLGQVEFTISGKIIDKVSGQSLPGANVFETTTEEGTSSNAEGEYSLLLPEGNYKFKVSYIGYNSIESEVYLNKNITIDFQLEPDPIAMRSIDVSGIAPDHNIKSTEISAVSYTHLTLPTICSV